MLSQLDAVSLKGFITAIDPGAVGPNLFWFEPEATDVLRIRNAQNTDWNVVGGGGGQPLDATLTALAAANWSANAIPIGNGADTLSQVVFAANTFPARASAGNLVATTISDFALTILDDANAATVRATIGAGTGNGDALTANPLSQFAATTSAQLLATLTNPTGTGLAVFNTSPTFLTGITSPVVTITQGTIAADAPQINGTVTWNNAGILGPAWLLNVTDTSSNSAAQLLRLQVGGADRFTVSKAGNTSVWNGGTERVRLGSAGDINATLWLAIGSTVGNPDVFTLRDAANIFSQRNGTAAQATRWENTYTSSTNREYATLDWQAVANQASLWTVKGSGGGTARALALGTDATARLTLGATGGATFATDVILAAAKLLSISSGSNQRAGNATLVGGSVTVSNTTVTANTLVVLTRKTSGGTIGTAITYTVSAGVSFTITSDNVLDTSTFSYILIEVP